MSPVLTALLFAFRKYVVDGMPASGVANPSKDDIETFGRLLETALAAAAGNLIAFETVALRDADTTQADGQLAYVWNNNGEADDPANGVYQWDDGEAEWVAADWYFQTIVDLVVPAVTPEAIAAITAAATTAAAAAAAAVQLAGDTQVTRVLTTPTSAQYATVADALSKGLVSVTISAGGSGGTNGSYPFTTTGGTGTGGAGLVVVTGGAISAIVVTQKGKGYTTGESLSYTVPGLTGQTLVLNTAQNETAGARFIHAAATGFASYIVDAGGTTATLVKRFVDADNFPVFTGRSGLIWGLIDSVKRKLRWVSTAGVGYSDIPEVFKKAVSFLSAVTLTGRLGLTGSTLGVQDVDYLSYRGDRSGWLFARVDAARKLLFGLRKDLTVWAGGKRLLNTDDLPTPLPADFYPTEGVAYAYTDSLGDGWPALLATLIGGGFTASPQVIGSQRSSQVAMRGGSAPIRLTVTGNDVAAGTTPVAVTHINGVAVAGMTTSNLPDYRLLSGSADNTTRDLPGWLAGHHVTLRRTASGGPPSTSEAYSIIPDSGNPGFKCPAGAMFIPDALEANKLGEQWPMFGINNLYDAGGVDQILADYDAFVAMQTVSRKRLLIFGLFPGDYAGEYAGGTYYELVREVNDTLRTRYPQFFCVDANGRDLHRRLVESYDSGDAQDVIDYGRDIVPSSLRADPRHLNADGKDVVAAFAFEARSILFPEA